MVDFNYLNYISVGLNGSFVKTGEQHTLSNDIDTLFEHLSTTGTKKLVLYFHGGLVNEQNGLQTAERMCNLFQEEAYTIAFVWKTGLLETLTQQLEAIYNSPKFQILKKYVSFRSSNKLGQGSGRGSGQAMTLNETERELQKENPFEEFDEIARQEAENFSERDLNNIENQLKEELEADSDRDSQFAELIEDYTFDDLPIPKLEGFEALETEVETTRGGGISFAVVAKTTFNIIKRHWQKRDHGFYPTVMEEIFRSIYLSYVGKLIWERMKNTAKAMWQPNHGEINTNSYVGTYFLEKLAALQKEQPDMVIDLIGHSAGSICICHLINTITERYSNLKIRNVIFMAPACTSDLFNENIVNKQNYYQNFRMFTMREELEIQDRLVPGIYTRSLLYFISGVLEDTADKPIAGLEFHWKGKSSSNYDAFIHYGDNDVKLRAIREFLLTPGSNRLVLSQTTAANPGFSSNSTRHGDFDSDETTLESLRAIISD